MLCSSVNMLEMSGGEEEEEAPSPPAALADVGVPISSRIVEKSSEPSTLALTCSNEPRAAAVAAGDSRFAAAAAAPPRWRKVLPLMGELLPVWMLPLPLLADGGGPVPLPAGEAPTAPPRCSCDGAAGMRSGELVDDGSSGAKSEARRCSRRDGSPDASSLIVLGMLGITERRPCLAADVGVPGRASAPPSLPGGMSIPSAVMRAGPDCAR